MEWDCDATSWDLARAEASRGSDCTEWDRGAIILKFDCGSSRGLGCIEWDGDGASDMMHGCYTIQQPSIM